MRKIILSTIAAAAISTGAFATLQAQDAPQLPGQMDASRVTAGTYAADASHSLIGWRVNHFGFNDYFGIFGDVAGTLTIDPANPAAAKVDVTVPIANVVTASEGLTAHLLRPGADGKAPDFFGAEAAPARFVSTSVQPTGQTGATINGDLTLNGVTKPVTIAAEFTGAGANPMSQTPTVGFEGTTTIRRSDFGVNGALPVVSDEVELNITIAFEKQ
ncbi:YceI family protein [Croceibacterium ferulae]|uniref:YceI family protein n=1 Tax=Croceibacterium ferulae TaxID=1854641 RepID=UPI000EB50ED1|nr:YceI family protein [Croceibacterium ferulae]